MVRAKGLEIYLSPFGGSGGLSPQNLEREVREAAGLPAGGSRGAVAPRGGGVREGR